MPNTNCLEGIKCPNPECGQEDAFDIEVTTFARVIDNGVEATTDTEWDDESKIVCPDCGKAGAVIDFKKGGGTDGAQALVEYVIHVLVNVEAESREDAEKMAQWVIDSIDPYAEVMKIERAGI